MNLGDNAVSQAQPYNSEFHACEKPGYHWNCALVTRSPLIVDRTRRMNENYGLKGPVHTLEQRRPWKYGLEHLPNLESFDVEFSPAGQVLRQTNYTNAEGVYRTSHFVYDNTGKLIRAVEFDGRGKE